MSKEKILNEIFTVTFLGMIAEELQKNDITLGYKRGDSYLKDYKKIAKDLNEKIQGRYKIKVKKSELDENGRGQGAVIAVKNFTKSNDLINNIVNATARDSVERNDIEQVHQTRYTGRGAYTGRIIFFEKKTGTTKKYKNIPTLETAEIKRKKTPYSSDESKLDNIIDKGDKWISRKKTPFVYGYEHGMCRCINKIHPFLSKRSKFEKPTVRFVPVECADGDETTKLAACVGCMTYLSANGYRPNAFHLGQSASWVPPRNNTKGDMAQGFRNWKKSVKNWGGIGKNILNSIYKIQLSKEASEILDNKIYWQYFLDSLTYHEKDIKRLKNIIYKK